MKREQASVGGHAMAVGGDDSEAAIFAPFQTHEKCGVAFLIKQPVIGDVIAECVLPDPRRPMVLVNRQIDKTLFVRRPYNGPLGVVQALRQQVAGLGVEDVNDMVFRA